MNHNLVTDLFHAHEEDDLDPALFPAAALQSEKILAGFADSEDAPQAFINSMDIGFALQAQAVRFFERMLGFMLAMTYAAPSKKTAIIIEAYEEFIDQDKWKIQSILKIFSLKKLGNMRELVKCLGKDQVLEATTFCDVSFTAMIYDCIAHDDLEAFTILSQVTEIQDPWQQKYGDLANFPLAPESRIHQHLIKDDNDLRNLFLARILNVRKDVEQQSFMRVAHQRFAAGSPPTLLASGQGYESRIKADLGPQLYQADAFVPTLQTDLLRCTQAFFAVKDDLNIEAPDGWDHIDAISQAFMTAGATPEFLITHGVMGEAEDAPPTSLEIALHKLGSMSPENLRFYSTVYRAYLKDFDHQALADACNTDEALQALYSLTRDKSFLKRVSDKARDSSFATDLGL